MLQSKLFYKTNKNKSALADSALAKMFILTLATEDSVIYLVNSLVVVSKQIADHGVVAMSRSV